MKAPFRPYIVSIASGFIGMLALVLISKGFDWLFQSEKRPFNTAILWIPWLIATIGAVNFGYEEGRKAQESVEIGVRLEWH
jgi:H+/Cl- antiporter ClcA